MNTPIYDVVVVGAGLSGLTTALSLQKQGLKVAVIEKNSYPGGLCGTFKLNDYEFVIGCNDFCEKVFRILEDLEVPIACKKAKTRFHFGDYFLDVPPTFSTFLKLIQHPLELIKTGWHLKTQNLENESLETFAQKYIKLPYLNAFIKLFAYPYGMTPREMSLSQLFDEFSKKYQYNHHRSMIPIGGPGAIITSLVKQFVDKGGELKLNTTFLEVQSQQGGKRVACALENLSTKYFVTSQGCYHKYPANFKPGLSISKVVVAVNKNFTFPDNYHTIIRVPPKLTDITDILTKIDCGIMPEDFIFHFFPHYPSDKKEYYTINIYFYMPRGQNDLSEKESELIKQKILAKMEKIMPGFEQAILYSQFISVNEFKSLHGVSSSVSPIIDSAFFKPDCYDPQTDIYYIGNTVYPPGNHAGAAMLSGILVADKIKEREAISSQKALLRNGNKKT